MRTALILGLAALLATTGSALAKTKTTVISLNGQCDVLTAHVNKNLVYGTDSAQCNGAYGGGIIGKVKGFGNAAIIGAQTSLAPGSQFVFELQYPFVTGGSWAYFVTNDGQSMTELSHGTYTVEGTPVHGPRGTKSVFALH